MITIKECIVDILASTGAERIYGITGDIRWETINTPKPSRCFCPVDTYVHSSSDKEFDDVASLLNKSHKVAIFAGVGCVEARKELLQLADQLKAPIIQTLKEKEFVDHDNSFNVGLTGQDAYEILMDCETLLLLGTDFPSRQFYPPDATIIQADIRAENIGRRTHVDYALIGDVKNTLKDLIPKLAKK